MKTLIVIVGQGYVGLPLAINAAREGFCVVGIDLNVKKVSDINNRMSPVEDVSNSEIAHVISTGNYKASSNPYIHQIGRAHV